MVALRYAAPFGVFRDFTAGFFRVSFPFAPPSALYGLILNLMGVEMRGPLGPDPTGVKDGLPRFEIASAAVGPHPSRHSFNVVADGEGLLPGKGVLFQQLHALPVGSTNKHRIPLTKGNKHHISPGRRQLLCGVRGVCVVRAAPELEARLAEALQETPWTLEGGAARYGLPFLGDNSFMLEELESTELTDLPAEWLVRLDPEADDDFEGDLEARAPFRLTLWADRAGMKTTRSAFFEVRPGSLAHIPPAAWVSVGPGE